MDQQQIDINIAEINRLCNELGIETAVTHPPYKRTGVTQEMVVLGYSILGLGTGLYRMKKHRETKMWDPGFVLSVLFGGLVVGGFTVK